MYPWIWRHLPGRGPVRFLWLLALLVVVALICFTWVFPWLSEVLPHERVVL